MILLQKITMILVMLHHKLTYNDNNGKLYHQSYQHGLKKILGAGRVISSKLLKNLIIKYMTPL